MTMEKITCKNCGKEYAYEFWGQFIREGKTKNTLTAHIVEKQRLQE